MRKSRSGAVRRLLLWLMLATAVLLNGCGVSLELQHLSQGGAMPSCLRGWVFDLAPPVFLLNNVSAPATPQLPKTTSSQQLDSPSALATTTQPPPPSPPSPHLPDGPHGSVTNVTDPHLQHNTSHQPAPAKHTTSTTTTPPTTTSTTTSTTVIPTSIPLIPVNPAKPATTPTVPAATIPITTPSIRPYTVPPIKTSTKKSNNEAPLNSKVGTLTFGEDGVTEAAPHRPPDGHRKHHAPHKPLIPARDWGSRKHHYNGVHMPDVFPKNSEQGKNFGKTKYQKNHKNVQPPEDDDPLTSQNDSEEDDDDDDDDDTYLQDRDEYDNPEESEEEGDEVDYKDDPLKRMNYYPTSGSHFHSSFGKLPHSEGSALPKVPKNKTANFLYPLNPLQHNMPAKDSALLWKSYLRGTRNKVENSLQNPHYSDLFTRKLRKRNKGQTPLLNDHESLPLIPSASYQPYNPRLPMMKPRSSHHPSHLIKDPSDGTSQYWDYNLHQKDSRHAILGRNRRDLTKPDSVIHVHPVKVVTNEMKPPRNDTLEDKQNPLEDVKSGTVKAGVAVLLVLGSLAGAGVEAGVAQLWHCFVHGYDESGVSQDVLQRTITHTFHLSPYGNHKTWTGITSGGWAVGAGVVSILACLAGTGGAGYGGLLGVHVALGMGALLLLLVLPVPYGSIDPPRTRRPLSLYLDDEVLREGVRRLTFHIWVFINGCLAALSLTFSLWLLQEMTTEGWLVGSQAGAVAMTLVCESLALHTQRRLVIRWGVHGLMGVCGVSVMLHYGVMWASSSVGVVVVAHAGLGVAMAFLWVAVKHNALLLATVSDQEREAWASWWCWRLGLCVGAAVWGVGVSGTGGRVRPLLLVATLVAAILASSLSVTAVLSRRSARARRRVYHTLDLDIANDEVDEEENDAAEDDWLVKRARKEGLTL